MATFEERELVDYTVKKIQEVMKPENFVIKDLDKMHIRLKTTEDRLRKIIGRIENLENRIRVLEKEIIFRKSNSESSSESSN